jgi:hypothetical protein
LVSGGTNLTDNPISNGCCGSMKPMVECHAMNLELKFARELWMKGGFAGCDLILATAIVASSMFGIYGTP